MLILLFIILLAAGLVLAPCVIIPGVLFGKKDTHWLIDKTYKKIAISLIYPMVLFWDFAVGYGIYKWKCHQTVEHPNTIASNVTGFVYEPITDKRENCFRSCGWVLASLNSNGTKYRFVAALENEGGKDQYFQYTISDQITLPHCRNTKNQRLIRLTDIKGRKCVQRQSIDASLIKYKLKKVSINKYLHKVSFNMEEVLEYTFSVHGSYIEDIVDKKIIYDNRYYFFYGNRIFQKFYSALGGKNAISKCPTNYQNLYGIRKDYPHADEFKATQKIETILRPFQIAPETD